MAKQKGRIQEQFVKDLKPPSSGQKITWDGQIDGFGVRVTANGAIAFVLSYYSHGRKRQFKIGRYPAWSADAARIEARRLIQEIDKGVDPVQERDLVRSERTLADLGKDYLDRYAEKNKRPSSIRNDKQMLENIVLPKLGSLTLKAIGQRDIEQLHHSLKATKYQANRVLSLLSKMFNLAIAWKWTRDNPAKGVARYHEDEREFWLDEKQVQNLFGALDAYPDQNAADAIRLMMYTGSREGEVLGSDWTQFDLQRAIWTKPSHHVKQKKTEHVPLNSDALRVLKRMNAAKTGSLYLFPGVNKSKARVTIWRVWTQVCKAAGLAKAIEVEGKRKKLTRWRPICRIHDLRHTFASHLVSRGESLHVVGRLLGHTRPQTTMRYAHIADAALRRAAESPYKVTAKRVAAAR